MGRKAGVEMNCRQAISLVKPLVGGLNYTRRSLAIVKPYTLRSRKGTLASNAGLLPNLIEKLE